MRPAKKKLPRTSVRKKMTTKPGRLHVRADLAEGGSLHVRHMADRVVLDGVAITLGDDDAKPVWIQLAKVGQFNGHSAGPFELSEKVFSEIVRNFNATANRRVPIDYEHASEADPTDGSIPVEGAPAQGWIVDMSIRAGELWGLVEWLPQARAQIKAGQYRYFSPAIRFRSKDRVTGAEAGARMTSGALTNNPFLDGMQPLAAKDAGQPTVAMRLAHAPHEYMPAVRAALRMPELCSATECSDMLARLRGHYADAEDDGTHEGIQLDQYMHPLRDLVDASPGTTWDEVFDIVQDLIDAAMDKHIIEDHGGEADEADMRDATSEAATSVSRDEGETMDQTMKLKELETSNATLSLELKDARGKVDKLEVELKALRDEKSARDTKDLDAEVDAAFETYKDAKSLSEQDKGHMAVLCKAAPEAFRAMYPRVRATERHLLRNVVPQRQATSATPIARADTTTIVKLADQLRKSNSSMSFDESLIEAEKQIRQSA